ncbi:uncharacterized protein TNIN_462621 [Trichonephila inaurata madagascariensis]|uniref:Uncharacterized protein n=1 Tax=Trichonephila inaurata madagascariensis TaxID=2747483 RepID=A0A8X6X8V1_9ARAC|nr:uncharacterized protein TNIN_462621 [Trichonephila inaurata madagascariensis]
MQDHPVPRKRSEAFDFKKLCLFWGQVADEATETKKKREVQAQEAAAATIREDIRSYDVEARSYPPLSKMLIKENQESLVFAASYGKTVQYEISIAYHPQPRILSSESGARLRYVGDNADINIHTLDGNNTLHVMGMIKIVTPKDVY